MDSSNPYQAPRAEIGTSNLLAGEIAAAVTGFARSGGPILFLACACIFMALLTVGQSLLMLATAYGTMGGSIAIVLVSVALNGVTYLVAGGALFWMWSEVRRLTGNVSLVDVTRVFECMARVWMVFAGLLCMPILSMIVMQVVPFVIPAAATVLVGLTAASDVVVAATRWRNMIKAAIVLGAVMMLITFAGTFLVGGVTPAVMGLGLQSVWLFGGVIVRVIFGVVLWRQVPALEAFIATPNAATLTGVATTHRFVWRVLAWGGIAALLLSSVGGVIMLLL